MTIDSQAERYEKVLGTWHIRERIGEGSKNTVVYRITKRERDGMWEETCALKAIPLIHQWGKLDGLSPERREEYERALRRRKAIAREEVKAMEKVRGESNIVTYIDSDAVEWETEDEFGCDFLIRMEYLHCLRRQIDSGKYFPEKEIIQVGLDICNAIAQCHRVDILHRDIKPENIFISDTGKYKLGDFGIARIMAECPSAYASTGVGTIEYAAPEQTSGKYDRRVDIYSLGIVLYELGNHNRLPFAKTSYRGGNDGEDILRRLRNEPLPEPDGVSPALARVILKACAFHPEDRYQTADEFARALRAAAGYTPISEEPTDIFVTIQVSSKEKLPKDIPVRLHDRTVSVRIPQKVKDGSVIRVSGAGNWNAATGQRGDLVVTVQRTSVHSPFSLTPIIAVCFALICILSVILLGRIVNKKQLVDAAATEPAASIAGITPEHDAASAPMNTVGSIPEEATAIPSETIIPRQYTAIACGMDHTVILYNDGTVRAIGSNKYGQCDVSDWRDIVQISTRGNFTVGLKSDGTVVAVGDNTNGQCNVRSWSDIVAVSASAEHTVGLRADGAVIATGDNENGECNVDGWFDVKAVSAGDTHTLGLKEDGTVCAVGKNEDGRIDVRKWDDVKEICAGAWHSAAIRGDGTVLTSGYGGPDWTDAADWQNITMLAAGNMFTVGLDANGNVHFGGVNDVGQQAAKQWTDIVYIAAGPQHIIGVKEDGTVVTAGANDCGQRAVAKEDLFPEE